MVNTFYGIPIFVLGKDGDSIVFISSIMLLLHTQIYNDDDDCHEMQLRFNGMYK